MRKHKRISILILFIFTIILFSPIIASISNNILLYNFSNQLNNLKVTSVVTFVENHSICGKLNGNGNGMDYLACVLIKTDLSADELINQFSNQNFEAARSWSNNVVEFDVLPVKKDTLESKHLEHGQINFNSLKDETDYKNYYALVIYDGGYLAGLDIRGHWQNI